MQVLLMTMRTKMFYSKMLGIATIKSKENETTKKYTAHHAIIFSKGQTIKIEEESKINNSKMTCLFLTLTIKTLLFK